MARCRGQDVRPGGASVHCSNEVGRCTHQARITELCPCNEGRAGWNTDGLWDVTFGRQRPNHDFILLQKILNRCNSLPLLQQGITRLVPLMLPLPSPQPHRPAWPFPPPPPTPQSASPPAQPSSAPTSGPQPHTPPPSTPHPPAPPPPWAAVWPGPPPSPGPQPPPPPQATRASTPPPPPARLLPHPPRAATPSLPQATLSEESISCWWMKRRRRHAAVHGKVVGCWRMGDSRSGGNDVYTRWPRAMHRAVARGM